MKTSKRLFNVGALTVMFSLAMMAGDQTAYGMEFTSADFTSSTISDSNMDIHRHENFVWNLYYKVWCIENSGGGFSGKFTVPSAETYKLIVTPLSSVRGVLTTLVLVEGNMLAAIGGVVGGNGSGYLTCSLSKDGQTQELKRIQVKGKFHESWGTGEYQGWSYKVTLWSESDEELASDSNVIKSRGYTAPR